MISKLTVAAVFFISAIFISAIFASAILAGSRPSLTGTWVLDASASTGNQPQFSSLSIVQDSKWFRSVQLEKDGHAERSVESECKTDGRFHPVSGTEGGSVKCSWDGAALVIEKHWNDSHSLSTTRVALSPAGQMIEDVAMTGSEGATAAHLVWNRKR